MIPIYQKYIRKYKINKMLKLNLKNMFKKDNTLLWNRESENRLLPSGECENRLLPSGECENTLDYSTTEQMNKINEIHNIL